MAQEALGFINNAGLQQQGEQYIAQGKCDKHIRLMFAPAECPRRRQSGKSDNAALVGQEKQRQNRDVQQGGRQHGRLNGFFPLRRTFATRKIPQQVNYRSDKQHHNRCKPLPFQNGIRAEALIIAQLNQCCQEINHQRTQTDMRTLLAQTEEINQCGFGTPQNNCIARFKIKRNGNREEQHRQRKKRLTQNIQPLLTFQQQRGQSVNSGKTQCGKRIREWPMLHHAVLQAERRRHRAKQ